jgi:hypothetical protein
MTEEDGNIYKIHIFLAEEINKYGNYILLLIVLYSLNFIIFLKNDRFNLILMYRLITQDDIVLPSEYIHESNKIYNLCRNPIRSLIILNFIISKLEWNKGRILCLVFLYVGLLIDSLMEESILLKYRIYQEYTSRVKRRFLWL